MELTLESAQAVLDRRDRSFMACDMDGYLDIWDDDCVLEMPSGVVTGKAALKRIIAMAWAAMEPVHFETRGFGINGNRLYQEFAIVWRSRATGERRLQTGMSVCECGPDGRWRWLRDYFADGRRESALTSERVRIALAGAS